MLINFNLERLDRLLYDFYTVTGLTMSVWNADFQQLSLQPREMCAFCRKIKSSDRGRTACYLSDRKLCNACSQQGQPISHYCHAGLIDLAFPIKFKDEIIGYMVFGQIARKSEEEMRPTLARLEKELGISAAELMEDYRGLIRYDEKRLASAAGILRLATQYLWLSKYIEIGYDETAARIDEYIKKNIADDISVSSLCERFGISKKRLYELSHRQFGASIGDYVCTVRLNHAKHLLSTTDHPVHTIAEMVGIRDYNYFTKFFKTRVGIPPLTYRKRFPFYIHDQAIEFRPLLSEE